MPEITPREEPPTWCAYPRDNPLGSILRTPTGIGYIVFILNISSKINCKNNNSLHCSVWCDVQVLTILFFVCFSATLRQPLFGVFLLCNYMASIFRGLITTQAFVCSYYKCCDAIKISVVCTVQVQSTLWIHILVTYLHFSFSDLPCAGSGVVRIDPLRFLAGYCKRRLNQVASVCRIS